MQGSQHVPCVQRASQLMSHISDLVVSMTTGVAPLDQLLPSGLLTGEIVELSGQSKVGKSQMCMQMAAFVAAQPEGRRNHVIYIDTAGAMDPARMIALLTASGCTSDQSDSALRKIVVFRALNSFSLLSILDQIDQNLSNPSDEFYANVSLLIVDCPTTLLASTLSGSKQSRHGHATLTHVMRAFKALVAHRSIAICCTAHTVADRAAFTTAGVKTALGESWTYFADHRIRLNEEIRSASPSATSRRHCTATLVKSSSFRGNTTVPYSITDRGIVSVDN